MNKALLSLLLAVCVLGMALIMLNERLSGDTPPIQTKDSSELLSPPIPESPPLAAQPEASVPEPQLQSQVPAAVQRVEEPVRKSETKIENQTAPSTGERAVSELRPIARTEQDIRRSEKEKEANRRAQNQERQVQNEQKKPAEKAQAEPKKADEKQTPAAGSRKAIKRFIIFARDKGATVRITGSGPMQYKSSHMHNPERVLIELDGNWDVSVPQIPKNIFVGNVRIGRQDNKTRVVLDLKAQPRSARVIQSKDRQNIDVRVDE